MPTSTIWPDTDFANGASLAEPRESLVTTKRSESCRASSKSVAANTSKLASARSILCDCDLRRLQFSYRPVKLIVVGDAVMPLRYILHEADTFAFAGLGKDQTRLTRPKGHPFKCTDQFADV